MATHARGWVDGAKTVIRKQRPLTIHRAGVYRGRKPSIDPEAIAALKAKGIGATAIARRSGLDARGLIFKAAGNLQEISKQIQAWLQARHLISR